MKARNDCEGQAGWMLLALVAMREDDLPGAYFEERFHFIEEKEFGRPSAPGL